MATTVQSSMRKKSRKSDIVKVVPLELKLLNYQAFLNTGCYKKLFYVTRTCESQVRYVSLSPAMSGLEVR